ncbi:MAG: type II toxin-antitoxin system YafQ family toxin [Treponema sp.]|jgi:mRNA interferase YafQ|nr:type II toxin-antitoxin system YafQ family toxin [Treponema sp.]
MLEVVLRKQFKKDYARTKKRGMYDMDELNRIMRDVAEQKSLLQKNRDHPLAGNFIGYRECHITGNWVLLYKITKTQIFFARTGTHADILE